jgi:predicted dinucleotide-binding enzyme
MGGKLGTIFARAGHDVVFSYARTKGKLEKLASDAGRRARAGTSVEAAKDADALLLAVHWSRVDDVLKKAGDLSGKVIVSCSLPVFGKWGSGKREAGCGRALFTAATMRVRRKLRPS